MAPVWGLSISQQMLSDEQHCGVELKIGVALFAEAVAFDFGHQAPDRAAVRFDSRDHLFGFRHGNSRIVAALDDKQRL